MWSASVVELGSYREMSWGKEMSPACVRLGCMVEGGLQVGTPWALVWICHSFLEAIAIVVGRVYVESVSWFSGVVWWGVVSIVIMACRMEWRRNFPPPGLGLLARVSSLRVAAMMAFAWYRAVVRVELEQVVCAW